MCGLTIKMWWIFVLMTSLIINADSAMLRQSRPYSAASESQIRFAIENNYDDTGPGAKGAESAYQAYKTLNEALVSYLDDPDTKLPDYEREKAIALLQRSEQNNYDPIRQIPKTVEEYTGYKQRPNVQDMRFNQHNVPNKQIVYRDPSTNYGYFDLIDTDLKGIPPKKFLNEKVNNVFSYHKVQAPKASPLNLAHYAKNPDASNEARDQFDQKPRYSYSYGVHDKHTGDSKSAHETRDGGIVRGFYTFIDSDGKQRTVVYTAGDKLGFRATVQRSNKK